ncbi:ABC1 family protein YPL109C, mitochondrial [Physcomitrium patens]|uniref:Protein kinase domain-containing protein n=1 Tax=Physcomitrium patens TaxID=3218 RepID=A0A2K1KU41_PHYPA|nr:ABC1 family protein YPL109C, mitochondrial-like [Physcomitrium patens]PNR57304.1 hypothetical protein PHYPA_004298 [Physcomitrium patens]|eukprot:XP_024370944.1 ABC1 family protein YPL109C, mitochondrial-like [Physcomitrella patens]
MAKSQKRRNWAAKLVQVQSGPVFSTKPGWAAQNTEGADFGVRNRKPEVVKHRGQGGVRIGNVRVSFPVKFGIGFGVGGIDSGGVVLRLARVEGGCGVQNDYVFDNIVSSGMRRRSGMKLNSAGNVLNAASVLLLSQAFCGPAATVAMSCLAVAGFIQALVPHVMRFFALQYPSSSMIMIQESLPSSVEEFSAASLLLSIGIPLLKSHNRQLFETLRCVGAAIPVGIGYAITTNQVKKLPRGGFREGEMMWRQRHRWAARRLCGLMTEFREPSSLGWLVDFIEKSTTISGTRGFMSRSSLLDANQQSLLIMSTPMPLCFKSRETCSHQMEAVKEIVVSTPPDIMKKDPNDDLAIMDSYNYNGSIEHIVGSLPTNDWEVVESTGTNDFLNELNEVYFGWRGFKQKWSLFSRACWLAVIFIPFIVIASLLYFVSTFLSATWAEYIQCMVWVMLRYCLEQGGAAFIKWGQWSSTREDLFPESLCRILGRLHDQAPTHSYKQTRLAILKHLKRPIEDIFDYFPSKPCASGSIAQVYKARLKDRGDGTPLNVAVKVRHPSVALRIFQDFQIMSKVADVVQGLPALRWLNLRQSIDQFSHTMTSQADLRVEAINLQRFYNNFQGLHQTVVWPKLIPDLVSEGVIVETFERGSALHEFLRKRSSLNTQIAAVGVDAYLKMILTDNFVHTDLHPGNILARMAENDKGECIDQLQLVLLDFGLAEELPPRVRYHFLSFIMNIGAADGERAAQHLLNFSWPNPQRCPKPELLVADMKELFRCECDLRVRPIDLNYVLKQVLQLCRKHEVTIDSSYASLVVAVCVLVGFARSLDPELSIMDAAVPCLFLYNLIGRIPGGIYG